MKDKICSGMRQLYVNNALDTCLLIGIALITFVVFYKYVYVYQFSQ
jgi:hypothetical protein